MNATWLARPTRAAAEMSWIYPASLQVALVFGRVWRQPRKFNFDDDRPEKKDGILANVGIYIGAIREAADSKLMEFRAASSSASIVV